MIKIRWMENKTAIKKDLKRSQFWTNSPHTELITSCWGDCQEGREEEKYAYILEPKAIL